jgi:phosphatidylinositol alpha-mannosyltransferase
MKVGFISFHSFANPGGVKNHILGLSKEFEKKGIETKIIVPRRKIWEKYEKNIILLGTSIPLNVAGTQGDLVFNLNPLAIKKLLEREQFDVLHFHNFIAPSAIQILEKSDSLNIITSHANVEAAPLIRKMIGGLNNSINRKVSGIIGIAPFNLDLFDKFEGPKEVIPNGVNLLEFNHSIKRLNKFDEKKINILFLGRIEERKGLIYLLKAYKILKRKYDNIRLIVVGDGPLKNECQEYVQANKLDDIFWEGKQTGRIVAQYYSTCDIYCSPAIFGESFGIVLLEAMASKKPVVAFSNTGYKELLKGTKGEDFLATPRDEVELSSKLEKLIIDEKLRKEMGEWGLKEAEKYSWDKIADRVLNFYKKCS